MKLSENNKQIKLWKPIEDFIISKFDKNTI